MRAYRVMAGSLLYLFLTGWCAVGLSSTAQGEVSEAWAASAEAARRLRFLDENAEFSGMYADSAFPVYVPESWVVEEDAELVLALTHSDLLVDSNITITLNQLALRTLSLADGTEGETQVLSIPARAIVAGWNVLRFRFYLRASDDPCRDIENPGLWAMLGVDSYLDVPHTLRAIVPDLGDFPNSYIHPDGGNEDGSQPRLSLLFSPSVSDAGLRAAATLTSRVGHTGQAREGSVRGYLLEGPRPETIKGTHIIFVGTVAQLPDLSVWGIETADVVAQIAALRAELPETGDYGVLIEKVSPFSPFRRLLFAIGSSEEGLGLLNANLENADAMGRLSGLFQFFLSNPLESVAELRDASKITLDALHLGDVALRGVSARSYHFKVQVPRHWRLNDQAHLQLFLQHSVSLRRSISFEVDLNGTPIFSRELVPDLGADEIREQAIAIPIPAELRGSRLLDVHFRLFIDVGSDDCARPFDDSFWAVVRGSSFLYLAHDEVEGLTLEQYPDLFVATPEHTGLGFVVDPADGPETISAFLAVATAMGSRAPDLGRLGLAVVSPNGFAELGQDERAAWNWVVFEQGALARQLQAFEVEMPVSLDSNGQLTEADKIAYSIPKRADAGGIVQLFRSPWNPARAVLLASAADPRGMVFNQEALGQIWTTRLSGNVTVVMEGLDALSYKVPVRALEQVLEETPSEWNLGWIWFPISLAGFIIAYGLLSRLRRRAR